MARFSLLRVIFSCRFIPSAHLKEKIFDLPTGELTKFRSNTNPFLQFLLIRYHHFNLPVAGRVEGLHNRNIDCSEKIFPKLTPDQIRRVAESRFHYLNVPTYSFAN